MNKCSKCKKLLSETGYSYDWHDRKKRCLNCFPLEEYYAVIDVYEKLDGYDVPQYRGDECKYLKSVMKFKYGKITNN